jgi:hypothetical protein
LFKQATNTVSLIRGNGQYTASNGVAATNTNGTTVGSPAWEVDYLPSQLQWSSTLSGPFVGGTPLFLILSESILGRVFVFKEKVGELPAVELKGSNYAPSEFLEPKPTTTTPQNNIALWYWEIDF